MFIMHTCADPSYVHMRRNQAARQDEPEEYEPWSIAIATSTPPSGTKREGQSFIFGRSTCVWHGWVLERFQDHHVPTAIDPTHPWSALRLADVRRASRRGFLDLNWRTWPSTSTPSHGISRGAPLPHRTSHGWETMWIECARCTQRVVCEIPVSNAFGVFKNDSGLRYVLTTRCAQTLTRDTSSVDHVARTAWQPI